MPSMLAAEALDAAVVRLVEAVAPERRAAVGALCSYVRSLARFGAHTDLVGARTEEALVEIALADALVLARSPALLCSPVWEVGAGGASLVAPLALTVGDFEAVLFEPRQKRATFLRMAVGTCGLAGRVRVDQSRIDERGPPCGLAGTALARAVLAPPQWLSLVAQIVRPEGTAAVLATAAVVADAKTRVIETHEYELPFSRARRAITWVRRVATDAP